MTEMLNEMYVEEVDQSEDKEEGSEDNSGGRELAPPQPHSFSSHFRHLESATKMCGMNEDPFHMQKGRMAMVTAHGIAAQPKGVSG